MLDVNVIGTMLCAREGVRRMAHSRGGAGGSIVNVSSRAAALGSPGEYVDYAASKGAVDTLTLGLAKEVAADGIRVNAVRPGLIETEVHARNGQPDRIARLAGTVPMGRGGRPEEVAESIVWLLSPGSVVRHWRPPGRQRRPLTVGRRHPSTAETMEQCDSSRLPRAPSSRRSLVLAPRRVYVLRRQLGPLADPDRVGGVQRRLGRQRPTGHGRTNP